MQALPESIAHAQDMGSQWPLHGIKKQLEDAACVPDEQLRQSTPPSLEPRSPGAPAPELSILIAALSSDVITELCALD